MSSLLTNKKMEWSEIRKTVKQSLVDFFIWFANFFFWWLPEKQKGYALLSLHVMCFIVLWILFFILPSPYNIIPLIVFILVLLQFYIFNGCIATKAEWHFHKSDITVVDPLLFILQIPPTNDVRRTYTKLCLTGSVVLMSLIIGSKPLFSSLYNVPERLSGI